MASRSSQWILFAAVIAVPILFVLVPLASFLLLSFGHVQDNAIIRDFSLRNYRELFTNAMYSSVFLQTMLLCLEVMILTILIGYPLAYFIWQRRGRMRAILLLLFIMPLLMSYIVKIYTMRSILGLNGFLNDILVGIGILGHPSTLFLYNRLAILLTMVVIFLPFVILPIFLSLDRVPRSLLQASSDLGASPFTTFRLVVFPLTLPGTIAGGLFTFILAFGDYVTPQMVGGPSGFTIGRVVWSQFGLAFNWPFGAAMGVAVFIFSLIIIAGAGLSARYQRL